jgi:hypothetical protein
MLYRVYWAVAWQRVDQIRYNLNKNLHCDTDKENDHIPEEGVSILLNKWVQLRMRSAVTVVFVTTICKVLWLHLLSDHNHKLKNKTFGCCLIQTVYRARRATVLCIGYHNDLLLGVVTDLLPVVHRNTLAYLPSKGAAKPHNASHGARIPVPVPHYVSWIMQRNLPVAFPTLYFYKNRKQKLQYIGYYVQPTTTPITVNQQKCIQIMEPILFGALCRMLYCLIMITTHI